MFVGVSIVDYLYLLLDKLGIDEKSDTIPIASPVFNFVFQTENRKIDFSDSKLVKNFMTFLNEPKKKKWLNNCLSLGLPIFPNIPFDKLGFEKTNIL